MSKAMKNLLANLKAKQAEAQALINKDDATAEEIQAKSEEIKAIQAKIKAQEALDEGKKFDDNGEEIIDKTPVNEPIHAQPKDHKQPFKNFGEQLMAVVQSSKQGAPIDERLLKVQNASGASEGVPSDGGFLVQQDFSSELIKNIHQTSILAPKCRKAVISANANSLRLNGVDESSRANGARWGGVQAYWADEAATVTGSKPKFRKIELTLNKLMALYYATDELLADAPAMESILSQAFAEELAFKTDDAIFRGSGAGQPLGILESGALVSVAKEANQANDTIVYENVVKMWNRLIASSRANSVWFINQEVEPQLHSMYLAIGTGGVPVYMPPSGISGQPYGTLFGRPVIPVEQASALGDKGDIMLVDMNQYLLADKGGVQTASSMHVKFEYDEMAFRVTYRVDGQPLLNKPITPYKGTNTISSFVTLAAR